MPITTRRGTQRATLFPYTTLFRSAPERGEVVGERRTEQRRGAHGVGEATEPGRELAAVNPGALRVLEVTGRSEEHTSELQSRLPVVCRLLLENKKESRAFLAVRRH